MSRATNLREPTKECVEREPVRAVRDRERREHRELRDDPDDAHPDPRWDLRAEVRRARALLGDGRHDAEADESDRPPDVVLGAVTLQGLDGPAGDDGGEGDDEGEREYVHAGAYGRRVLHGLEVYGEIVWTWI